jgi:hypothetical protein
MMYSTLSRFHLVRSAEVVKALLRLVFVSTAALSIKAAYDISEHAEIFPAWFMPGFTLSISALIALSLYFLLQTRKTESHLSRLTRKQSAFLWIAMMLSFICTASVHGFYPFHRNVLLILPAVDSVMKINYAIGLIGFLACAVFAGMYLFGHAKAPAIVGLLSISLMMLIPNDNCRNPFNYWWIDTIGASPLMYVPNLYAALFVTCGLYGTRPKSAGVVVTAICLGSLLLGLGHQLGIIW